MQYFKLRQMTNDFQAAVLLAACVALSGCADATWPNRLTGEPDAAAIGQSRAGIPRIDNQGAQWPNLATVPPRPTDIPALATRQQQVAQLNQDRSEGAQFLQTQAGNVPAVPVVQSSTLQIGLERAAPAPIAP